MINNVAFTGREAMLGTPVKKAAKTIAEQFDNVYTGIGKNYTKAEIEQAKILVKNAKSLDNKSTMAERIASYEAAHQPIVIQEPVAKTANIEHIDFFA